MTEREERVAAILEAAGGQLVSRVRLQKIAYLLDQLGMHTGFDYQYHHYGPYSRELDSAIADAKAFDFVAEEFGNRKSDGARYSIFRLKKHPTDAAFGGLRRDQATQLVSMLAATNVTVLELAATAHWLVEAEKVDDWQGEIKRRKGAKTEGGRLAEAVALLSDLHLSPDKLTATA
jgi:uncharacterized protein YwgA